MKILINKKTAIATIGEIRRRLSNREIFIISQLSKDSFVSTSFLNELLNGNDRTLAAAHIFKIRMKLGEESIECSPTIGYRLGKDIEFENDIPSEIRFAEWLRLNKARYYGEGWDFEENSMHYAPTSEGLYKMWICQGKPDEPII